jgi:hypothetical protein
VAALVAEARKLVPPQLTAPDGGPLPGGLVWRRVQVDQGVLWFLCNPWQEPIDTEVLLPGQSAVEFDTSDGSTRPLKSVPQDGGVVLPLHLPSRGHTLWLVRDEPQTDAVPAAPLPVEMEVSVSEPTVERLADNVMFIDYCDFQAPLGGAQDVNTAVAYQKNWGMQGWECGMRGAWTKQFLRNVVDREPLPGSFLEVTYRFAVDPAVVEQSAETLRIVIERAGLYDITLNDQALDAEESERYRDPDWRAIPVGNQIAAGENVLTLRAEPFTALHEIMPVYLLGDFALEPAERGFVAVPATTPGLEDWTGAGYPFYDQKMRYRFEVDLPEPCNSVRVHLPDWDGPVADITWDGEPAGAVLHPPFDLQIDGPHAAGPHELVVDVVGNMKNFMGPHFWDGLPGIWSWVICPDHMPAGEEYRVYPTGLFAEPQVTMLRK